MSKVLLTDNHKKILLQLYYREDRQGYADYSLYLASDGLLYNSQRIYLWGGCNSGNDCRCYGGCSSHKGQHIDNYDGKSMCNCKGDKFHLSGGCQTYTKNELALIDDLADLVHMDLIEQYKGHITLTDKALKIL